VDAVNVEEQVAEAVVPAKVHVVNVPVTPVSESATVPVGVAVDPVDVSATVTLHVDGWLITTGVVQLTVVEVVIGVTRTLVVPLLPV
jgi:hypothetical protein